MPAAISCVFCLSYILQLYQHVLGCEYTVDCKWGSCKAYGCLDSCLGHL